MTGIRYPRNGEVWGYTGNRSYRFTDMPDYPEDEGAECTIQRVSGMPGDPVGFSLAAFRRRIDAWVPPPGRGDSDAYEVFRCTCGGAYVLAPGEEWNAKCEVCR